MGILVVIPCLYGPGHTKEAIESVINKPGVDILLIDNGAEPSVKQVIDHYDLNYHYVHVIHNQENIYVNPAWHQGIEFFINSPDYDYLVIMNSDLIMHQYWAEIASNIWASDPDAILIPQMTQDKNFRFQIEKTTELLEVHEGTPGVFITLNRKQAEIIHPLPKECKVWFGDQWCYEILRGCGYRTVIPSNLWAYHYWSQNVQKVAGISEIIEEDKRQWETVKHRKAALIELHRIK